MAFRVLRITGFWAGAGLLLAGCIGSSAPMLGIVSPDAIGTRYLRLRNRSQGYVVFRVTAPGAEPLLTPAMSPGAEQTYEMAGRFGSLCPERLRLEMAAYARLRPELSPLEDETLSDRPYAAYGIDLLPTRHFGCSADLAWISLDTTIDCSVLEVDESAGAVGFSAGWLPPQRQTGVQLDDPPLPTAPEPFPLNGSVVNLNHQPLPNVEIRLPQLNASVFTDERGRFSVLRPAGNYLLEPVLPCVELSPAVHSFSHLSPEEVPIEFIALTDADSVFCGAVQ